MSLTAAVTAPTPSAAPAPASVDGSAYTNNDFAWLLARRATMGATPELIAEMKTQGALSWLNDQLAPTRIDDSAYEAMSTRFNYRDMTVWQAKFEVAGDKRKSQAAIIQVQQEHVSRLLWSRRQLQAVLTDFWGNHFNVTADPDALLKGRPNFQGIFRRLALGKFSDMLFAVSRHPSMLTYLNNRTSTWLHPNENLGREILELHTLGINNYTEADVLSATRVLTGLSVCEESGRYEYKPWYHWTGAVSLLGWSHANDSQEYGYQVAADMFSYLANHPATARRVCTKLAQHFVAEEPPASLIARMIATYLSNDTAIAPVLRLMFTSPEFATSHGKITRRPLESIAATVRLLGLKIDGTGVVGIEDLRRSISAAGHEPFGWEPPDGYSTQADVWAVAGWLHNRWNTTRSLATGTWPAQMKRPASMLAHVHPSTLPATYGQFLDNLCLRFFGRTMAPAHRAAVLTFFSATESTALTSNSPILTTGLPDCLALVLNSPYHSYR